MACCCFPAHLEHLNLWFGFRGWYGPYCVLQKNLVLLSCPELAQSWIYSGVLDVKLGLAVKVCWYNLQPPAPPSTTDVYWPYTAGPPPSTTTKTLHLRRYHATTAPPPLHRPRRPSSDLHRRASTRTFGKLTGSISVSDLASTPVSPPCSVTSVLSDLSSSL
ncbi:hypothetical protein U1Q18_035769, partial [Sarracenia purpurea var. burkii]